MKSITVLLLILFSISLSKKKDNIQKTLTNLRNQISDRFENLENKLTYYNSLVSNETKNAYAAGKNKQIKNRRSN